MDFLVIRFSSIGDIVLTTPVLRCLKNRYPDCKVHFVVKKNFLPVIEHNPHIDHFHVFDGNWDALFTSLKPFTFDHVIDLHKNIRSLRIKRHVKAPSLSFDKLNMQKWLMVNLKVNRLPNQHIVDRYFDALKPLDVNNDGKGAEYHIPDSARKILNDLPDKNEPYVVMVTGGRYFTKQIPPKKLVEVCRLLEMPVVLIGGAEDKEQADLIENSLKDNRLVNFCGKISLNESAAIIDQAACIITPDTGMMHIAAALNKKVVSVWGNTIPAFGMYPYYGSPERNQEMSRIIELEGLSCRPCTKLGYGQCPKKHFACMEEIQAEEISKAVNDLLNENR